MFSNRWIGHSEPVNWPARSPDLTILDYFLWDYIKDISNQNDYDSGRHEKLNH